MEKIKEIADLQYKYYCLKKGNKLSKKAMCDLVIPFRDKYDLKDSDALLIARAEVPSWKICNILKIK